MDRLGQHQRRTLKPQAVPPGYANTQLTGHPATQQAVGKIIDWEAFNYGMLDHKFLNDPNPAVADHRRTIYELWVGDLIAQVMEGDMPVYSKDGQLPRRLADADRTGIQGADTLIGCLFDTQRLLENMDTFFSRHKELH